MAYFVTGANGFIGSRICEALASRGESVIAFCRRPGRQNFESPSIHVCYGDVCNRDSLSSMRDAEYCFHLASLAKPWSPNPQAFFDVNVGGTKNVLLAAKKFGIRKLVFTSTAGVYGPSLDGEMLNEWSPKSVDSKSDYEKSKAQAELLVNEFSVDSGLSVCTVNPTRVFGPGKLSDSNAVTKLICQFLKGGIQLVPSVGHALGNYVLVDDVVKGHLLALERGQNRESYVLGGTNLTIGQLFSLIDDLTGNRSWKVPIPLPIIKTIVKAQDFLASRFGRRPFITAKFLDKYTSNNPFSHARAERELGYLPVGIGEGISFTIDWINAEKSQG